MLLAGLSFVVLLALCAGFMALRGVPGAAAPLLAVSTVMVWFSFAVVWDLLVPAGWLFILLVAVGLGLALWRRRAELLEKLCSPGFLIFAGLGLTLLVVLGLRQPVFKMWDEFSFSGPAAKLLMLDNSSYAVADTGFFTTMTDRPGPIVLNWFMQFFCKEFAQWRMYWAFDLLLLACAVALLAPVERKSWRLWVPLAAVGVLIPFFFTLGYHTVVLATPYLSVYRDLPAGMLFGGTLVLYFAARRARQGSLWQAVLPLMAFGLMKENTVPITLVAAGVMAADGLFFGLAGGVGQSTARLLGHARQRLPFIEKLPAGLREAVKRLAAAAGWFAAVLVVYLPWSRHAAWAFAQNPVFDYGARETNIPVVEAALMTFRQLAGLEPRGEAMARVLAELPNNFVGRTKVGEEFIPGTFKVSMAGSPLLTVLLIAAVTLAAVLCLRTRTEKLRCGTAGVLLLGGFAAYHFVLIVFWAVLNRTNHTEGVVDYERYLSAYTPGWFMVALCFLAIAASTADKKAARPGLARGGVLALALLMVLRFGMLVRPGYSVLDFSQSLYAAEKQRMATAAGMQAKLPPGARVFFVCQGENGGDGSEWMAYHLYLLPNVLDYSITGGWHFVPEVEGNPDAGVSPERMAGYLEENKLDYILIDKLDAGFVETYGALFADELAGWEGPALYQRNAAGLYEMM